jgi:hypothetical protein
MCAMITDVCNTHHSQKMDKEQAKAEGKGLVDNEEGNPPFVETVEEENGCEGGERLGSKNELSRRSRMRTQLRRSWTLKKARIPRSKGTRTGEGASGI